MGQLIALDLSYFIHMVFRDRRHFQIAIEINVYFFKPLGYGLIIIKTKTITEAIHVVKL